MLIHYIWLGINTFLLIIDMFLVIKLDFRRPNYHYYKYYTKEDAYGLLKISNDEGYIDFTHIADIKCAKRISKHEFKVLSKTYLIRELK